MVRKIRRARQKLRCKLRSARQKIWKKREEIAEEVVDAALDDIGPSPVGGGRRAADDVVDVPSTRSTSWDRRPDIDVSPGGGGSGGGLADDALGCVHAIFSHDCLMMLLMAPIWYIPYALFAGHPWHERHLHRGSSAAKP